MNNPEKITELFFAQRKANNAAQQGIATEASENMNAGNQSSAEVQANASLPAVAAPSKYHDECDATTSFVEHFFSKRPLFCTEECPKYRPLSDSCEALDTGMAQDCPEVESLIQQEIRSAEDEWQADHCR